MLSLVTQQFGIAGRGGMGRTVVPGVPGNVIEWGFEGSTDAAASGPLVFTDLESAFIPSSAWSRATDFAIRGSQSVKQTYACGGVPGPDVGDGMFYRHPSQSQPSRVFVRFAYRQDFANGTQDWTKLWRGRHNGFATQLANLGLDPYGYVIADFGDVNDTHYISTVTLNDRQKQWTWLEIMADYTSSPARIQVWVNDALVLSISQSFDGTYRFDIHEFVSIVNGCVGSATAWVDALGISTERMGIP